MSINCRLARRYLHWLVWLLLWYLRGMLTNRFVGSIRRWIQIILFGALPSYFRSVRLLSRLRYLFVIYWRSIGLFSWRRTLGQLRLFQYWWRNCLSRRSSSKLFWGLGFSYSFGLLNLIGPISLKLYVFYWYLVQVIDGITFIILITRIRNFLFH